MSAAVFCEELEVHIWRMEDVAHIVAEAAETAMTVKMIDGSEFYVSVEQTKDSGS